MPEFWGCKEARRKGDGWQYLGIRMRADNCVRSVHQPLGGRRWRTNTSSRWAVPRGRAWWPCWWGIRWGILGSGYQSVASYDAQRGEVNMCRECRDGRNRRWCIVAFPNRRGSGNEGQRRRSWRAEVGDRFGAASSEKTPSTWTAGKLRGWRLRALNPA
jgi:hypothetical protein